MVDQKAQTKNMHPIPRDVSCVALNWNDSWGDGILDGYYNASFDGIQYLAYKVSGSGAMLVLAVRNKAT